MSPNELFDAYLKEVDGKGSTIESIEHGSMVRREMVERSAEDKSLIARMISDHFIALSKEAVYADKMPRHLILFRRLATDMKLPSPVALHQGTFADCFKLQALLVLAEFGLQLE